MSNVLTTSTVNTENTFTFNYEAHKSDLDHFRPRLREAGQKILRLLNEFRFAEAAREYELTYGDLIMDEMYGGSQPGETRWDVPYYWDNIETIKRLDEWSKAGVLIGETDEFFELLNKAKKFATFHSVECIETYYDGEDYRSEEGELCFGINQWCQLYKVW